MIRTPLTYRATNPEPSREMINTICQCFSCTTRGPDSRNLWGDLFHQCFVPEFRRYLASKGLPFKILLILDNALGHPEPREFNTEGIKVVSFPLNTTSLSQPIDQRVRGTFKAQYTWHSMEMFVNAMEENPDGKS